MCIYIYVKLSYLLDAVHPPTNINSIKTRQKKVDQAEPKGKHQSMWPSQWHMHIYNIHELVQYFVCISISLVS